MNGRVNKRAYKGIIIAIINVCILPEVWRGDLVFLLRPATPHEQLTCAGGLLCLLRKTHTSS